MTESMLDRVGKAICLAAGDDCPARIWTDHEKMARAAIEAMREPTTEMWRSYIQAKGYNPDKKIESLDEELLGLGALAEWQSLIDGALQE